MEQKFIVVGREVYRLVRGEDGFYRDAWGCIWALEDDKASVDPLDRCGVGLMSLPVDHPLNTACKIHDYQFSCPVYQAFYTRAAADKQLLNNLKLIAKDKWYSVMAKPFYWISRLLGSSYWENERTNK